MKERAIEFAEWIYGKRMTRSILGEWGNEIGFKFYPVAFTTKELYLLFEKENPIIEQEKESVYGC